MKLHRMKHPPGSTKYPPHQRRGRCSLQLPRCFQNQAARVEFSFWLGLTQICSTKKIFKLTAGGRKAHKTNRYSGLHKKQNINGNQNNTNSSVLNPRSLPSKKKKKVSYFNSSGYVSDVVLANVVFQKWAHWLRICLLLC